MRADPDLRFAKFGSRRLRDVDPRRKESDARRLFTDGRGDTFQVNYKVFDLRSKLSQDLCQELAAKSLVRTDRIRSVSLSQDLGPGSLDDLPDFLPAVQFHGYTCEPGFEGISSGVGGWSTSSK